MYIPGVWGSTGVWRRSCAPKADDPKSTALPEKIAVSFWFFAGPGSSLHGFAGKDRGELLVFRRTRIEHHLVGGYPYEIFLGAEEAELDLAPPADRYRALPSVFLDF
jgi:hypothetical protein